MLEGKYKDSIQKVMQCQLVVSNQLYLVLDVWKEVHHRHNKNTNVNIAP
jgi:hypothetical protein